MEVVNRVGSSTEMLKSKITEVEQQVQSIEQKVKMAKGAMDIGNKLKSGDLMGGLSDIGKTGMAGNLGGFGGNVKNALGGFGF